MNINGINGAGSQSAPAGTGQAMDVQSKNIRKQIEEARKKLQEISANGEISPEEKMKKRQEIQKQINDLRMQLQKHQTEVRRQQQAEKRAAENQGKVDQKQEGQAAGISTAGMQAVISADNSMKQARVQNGVAVKMEGRAGVLEAEIRQDGKTGGNTQAKEVELAETKEKADAAKASGIETLKEADRKMEEATGAEQSAGPKRADAETGAEKAEETERNSDTEKADGEAGKEKAKAEETDKNSGEPENKTGREPGRYVDVRL